MSEARRHPSAPGGLAQAIGEQFSLEKSIGGVRGVLESVLPVTVFSVVYGISQDVMTSSVAALVPALALAVWRLVRGEPLTQAFSGMVVLVIGAVWAVRTGRAQDFFLPTILKNLAYGAGYALSALVKWPVIGVLLGFALGEGLHWRQVPERRRAYSRATWVWVGAFGLRLAVEIPLFLLGMATALGYLSIPLGLPVFLVAIWWNWIIIRKVPVVQVPRHDLGEDDGTGRQQHRNHTAGQPEPSAD